MLDETFFVFPCGFSSNTKLGPSRMTTAYTAFRYVFYAACILPALLLLSSFGSSMDPDANQKLTRGIIALIASGVLGLLGLLVGAVASSLRSVHARSLWIAAAIAVAPGVLTFIAVTLATHR